MVLLKAMLPCAFHVFTRDGFSSFGITTSYRVEHLLMLTNGLDCPTWCGECSWTKASDRLLKERYELREALALCSLADRVVKTRV